MQRCMHRSRAIPNAAQKVGGKEAENILNSSESVNQARRCISNIPKREETLHSESNKD